MSVRYLGEFHGGMYALKLTDANTFNNMKSQLVIGEHRQQQQVSMEWGLFLELGIRRATASVRATKTAQNIVPEKFLKGLERMMHGALGYRKKQLRPVEPIAIICHCDYLRNNIAFRYDDNSTAVQAMMFDFQTMCYASPMIDLATFMANSTGYEVRNKHFKTIFAAYHESLISNFLTASTWKENEIPDFLT